MTHGVRWICVSLLVAACGEETTLSSDAATDVDSGVVGPAVACGTSLPGPALANGVIEGMPGYAAELAAMDVSSVPLPIDLSGESALVRAIVNYTLGISGQASITAEQIAAGGKMGEAVLGAIVASGDGSVDLRFLRRGLHYFTPCVRPLPATLDVVRERYGDWTTWPREDLGCSAPKNTARALYTSPEGRAFVAETLEGGSVRETEILFLDLRTDEQLDFAPYTSDGMLTDRSTFATASSSIVSASPYTCMACHYDTGAQIFNDQLPTGTGAGCNFAKRNTDTLGGRFEL